MKSKFVDLNRLEFFVTDICNARCKHCSVNGRRSKVKHIDEKVAVDAVIKLSREYNLESVMTFGGEPLLFPEVIYGIHEAATKAGIPARQIITNGFWSKDYNRIKEIARRLAEVGVNKILISVDAFHQEYIPLTIVKKAAEELLKVSIADIKWTPCWVVSKEDDNPYNHQTRLILNELEELQIKVGSGNVVFPQGATLENLVDYLPEKKQVIHDKCGELPYTDPLDLIKTMSMNPNGDIIVCNDFKIGNAIKSDVVEIFKTYNPNNNVYMKTILENGVHGLKVLAQKQGFSINRDKFYSICEMCTYLRNQLDNA